MNRPTHRDESVLRRAAELSLPKFRKWLKEDSYSEERIIRDLIDAITYAGDGYEQAKRMESRGYPADSELVELLDNVDVWGAEREAVEAWVAQSALKAPLPIGTLVDYQGRKGEITQHDEKLGKATVTVEFLGHVRQGLGTHGFLVAWEKLKPMGEVQPTQ